MTDTITPASLRAHADWMVQRDEYWLGSTASMLRTEAARLEAESARDGEAEKLAEDLAFAYCLGFGHDADEFKWNPGGRGHDAWLAVARQVLVLAADGRLLPEGGTATVASDANIPVDQHMWVYCEYQDFARNCEFRCEATGCDWRGQDKAEHAEHVDRIATQERLRRNPETLARVQKAQAERDQDVRVEDTPPAVSVPDSGPDGTPEKPWPTWQDVPDGVVYRGARDTSGWGGWFNRGGARRRFFDGALSKNTEAMIADEAPFVRVDGDKA